jgi:hypothetical protein
MTSRYRRDGKKLSEMLNEAEENIKYMREYFSEWLEGDLDHLVQPPIADMLDYQKWNGDFHVGRSDNFWNTVQTHLHKNVYVQDDAVVICLTDNVGLHIYPFAEIHDNSDEVKEIRESGQSNLIVNDNEYISTLLQYDFVDLNDESGWWASWHNKKPRQSEKSTSD